MHGFPFSLEVGRDPAPNDRPLEEPGRAVLLPLSHAAEAPLLLAVAAALARALRSVLHLLHVTDAAVSQEIALRRLALAPHDLQGAVLDVAVGPPAASVVRAARTRRPWLVVTAARGPEEPADQTLGAVARETLRKAPCPVVVVPATATIWPDAPAACRILLPLNGTPTTAAAIGPVLDLAHRCGGVIDVLHVAETGIPRALESGSLSVPRYVDQPQHEWPAWVQEFLERMCCFGQCPTVKAHLHLAAGDPTAVILQTAAERQSNLIALIWRGRLSRHHGRVVAGVLAAAPCPVLLVRVPPPHSSAAG